MEPALNAQLSSVRENRNVRDDPRKAKPPGSHWRDSGGVGFGFISDWYLVGLEPAWLYSPT
jgi:hypothetical protein